MEEKDKSTTSSSLQACFVVAHSSGDSLMSGRPFVSQMSPDEWATTKQACRDELVVS